MLIKDANSITQPFIHRAQNAPDESALIFIDEDGLEESITVGQLYADALAQASVLKANGIQPGEVVILVLPYCRELLAAFWGTLFAGAIPSIFTYLTPQSDIPTYLERAQHIIERSAAQAAITSVDLSDALSNLQSQTGCHIISVEQAAALKTKEVTPPHAADPEEIAILQYSSGTTGARKGILLSHRAVLNYLASLTDHNRITAEDAIVSWLPLYHDLGLIIGFIFPLILGIPAVLISPFYWIWHPSILIQSISKYKGTLCWMPNFAFKRCADAISDADLEGVDLSHWRTLTSGGEPANLEHMQAFRDRFEPYGFKESALAVGYGMAENTLGVTKTPLEGPPRVEWVDREELQENRLAVPSPPHDPKSKPMVSCGFPLPTVEIQILDEAGQPLPDRAVGEVIFRSQYMFSGYHRQPELTAQSLRDGWFHSGDLAYTFEGQLYVTGRTKDLMIVGGTNIYPQDVESLAANFPEIRPGRAVAFSLPNLELGTERIVLVAELRQPLTEPEKNRIIRELSRQVKNALDVGLSEVHLIAQRNWVVKTPSGKLARSASREKYQETLL